MNEKLRARVELFAQNSEAIRPNFRWQFAQVKRLAALAYALEDRAIDVGAMRDGYDQIKRLVGPFSMLRGNMAISIAASMALSDDPAQRLDDTLAAYGKLKAAGFYASDFLVIAAQQIAARHSGARQDEPVARARAFYAALKRNHWLLTGPDDQIFCAVLALSDMDVQLGADRIARLYDELKLGFHWPGSVQMLAEVLALGGGTADRALALNDALRAGGVRMGGMLTLSSLGVLALLPMEPPLVVDAMADVCALLREQPGLGRWSVLKSELLVLATALVASGQVDEAKRGLYPALSTSIANLALAQQAALAAAASASAAVAAASSSS